MAKKEKYIGDSLLLGTPNSKLGFVIKDRSITLSKLAVEVINFIISHGGGDGGEYFGVNIVDIAGRMSEENDTVTDMEISNSLFVYDVYNRVSAIARVVEPSSNTRYALFKVSYYDNVGSKNKIDYIAYTTSDDFVDSATWHYNRILDESDTLYPWAMSVFGDAVVDCDNNLLVVGNNKYQLERISEEPQISYIYSVPEITQFKYPTVSADGGIVYPTVKFKQIVIKTLDYGTRTETENFTLTGIITFDGTSYSDKSLVIKDASCTFTGNNPYQSGGIDTIGAVTVGPSDVASVNVVRTVRTTLFVNDQRTDGNDEFEVLQNAATMDSKVTATATSAGGENIVEINKSLGVTVDNVRPNEDWIIFNAVTSEDNKVSVKYTVLANTGTAERKGTITVVSDVAGLQCEIEITQSATQSVINVSNRSIQFGNQCYIGSSYTQDIYVYGTGIRNNVYATVTGSDFSVNPISITPAQANAAGGYRLTVTFTPTMSSTSRATLTLSSNGADNVTVNLSGTGATRPVEAPVGYWGVNTEDTTLPTSINQAIGSFEVEDGYTVRISQYGRVHWIAIPLSVNATVVGTGALDLPFTLHSDDQNNRQISGYALYYRLSPQILADQANFKISM